MKGEYNFNHRMLLNAQISFLMLHSNTYSSFVKGYLILEYVYSCFRTRVIEWIVRRSTTTNILEKKGVREWLAGVWGLLQGMFAPIVISKCKRYISNIGTLLASPNLDFLSFDLSKNC